VRATLDSQMTPLDEHPRIVYAAVGFVFLIFGAYALRLKKAELPLHFWSLSVSKEEQPFGYWLTVMFLFLLAVTCLYRAWTGAF
jgi:hypothetical protein